MVVDKITDSEMSGISRKILRQPDAFSAMKTTLLKRENTGTQLRIRIYIIEF